MSESAEVVVAIPWRGTSPERQRNFEFVKRWFERHLPEVPILFPDSGHQPFNRGASRNAGVTLAEASGARVVVLCDADTVPEIEPLKEAIYAASKDDKLHLPYTEFRGLTELGTRRALAGKSMADQSCEDEHSYATGGILVIQPKAYWKAGGHPELVGWGFEDTIFRICADALLGPTVRHTGTIHHLWHPKDWNLGSDEYLLNKSFGEMYAAIEGNTSAIQRMVSRRDRDGTIQRRPT